jgi:hypothetical protein
MSGVGGPAKILLDKLMPRVADAQELILKPLAPEQRTMLLKLLRLLIGQPAQSRDT